MKTNARQKRLSAEDVSLFCEQIFLLLKSGVPLESGIPSLCEDTADKEGKALIQSLSEFLAAGDCPFYQALKKTGAFPGYMVGMVEIGEKAGRLEDVMQEISLYYERESQLKRNLTGAVGYPLMLVAMMTVVMSVLVWKVLPVFHQVFEGFSGSSGTADTMMQIGNVIGICALVVSALLLVFLIAVYLSMRAEKGATLMERLLRNKILESKAGAKMAAFRFASVLHLMFLSGYHAEEALELAGGVVENDKTVEKIEECKKKIAEGSSLAEALESSQIFSGIHVKMIKTGFQTGTIDIVMKKLADVYAEEAQDAIQSRVSLVEPVLVGALTVVIGAILLSMMLPLVGILSSIG